MRYNGLIFSLSLLVLIIVVQVSFNGLPALVSVLFGFLMGLVITDEIKKLWQ